MKNRYRQEFLRACKAKLDVTWDEFAELCELEPRAFKTYRMPEDSKDSRGMPKLVYAKVLDVMVAHGFNRNMMEKLGESLDNDGKRIKENREYEARTQKARDDLARSKDPALFPTSTLLPPSDSSK